MPRYNQNRMSLNTVGFTPTVFNAVAFQPVEQDISILDRAMARQEERKEKALEKQSAFDETLAKMELQLSNDETTRAYWREYKNELKNRIKSAVDVGDYSEALFRATNAAGDLVTNTALLTNIAETEKFNKWKDSIANRKDINDRTKQYFTKLHSYQPIIERDENGNVNFSKFDDTVRPVADIDWFEEYKATAAAMHAKQGGGSVKDANGNITTTRSSRLKAEDIDAFMKERLKEPNMRAAILQDMQINDAYIKDQEAKRDQYEVGSDEYNQIENAISEERKLLYANNGSKLTAEDYENYYLKKVNSINYSKYLEINDNVSSTDYNTTNSSEHLSSLVNGINDRFNFNSKGAPVKIKLGFGYDIRNAGNNSAFDGFDDGIITEQYKPNNYPYVSAPENSVTETALSKLGLQ